jgi:hypothetical protein
VSEEQTGAGPTVVVGLVADPGLPYQLARELAADLADELREQVADSWDWRVVAIEHRFAADEQGELALKDIVEIVARQHQLDVVVCITDQPRRSGIHPIVADINRQARVAITSLPALGAIRLRRRTRHAVIRLVAELVEGALESLPPEDRSAGHRHRRAALSPFVRTTPVDGPVDVRFVGGGRHTRARLLTGMVRANRPWLLVPQLSGAFAAAFAAGVLVLITQDAWQMAASLGWVRLVVAAVVAVATMVAWLIVDHEMWERSGDPEHRELARLYNATTLITVTIGVLCLYTGLFVTGVLVEGLFLPHRIVEPVLGRSPSTGDYLALAWLLSAIATVAGAVGTGFASDEAVRQAAYGYRQRERRSER